MAVSESLVNRLNELLLLAQDNEIVCEGAIESIHSARCRRKVHDLQNDYQRHHALLADYLHSLPAPIQERNPALELSTPGLVTTDMTETDEQILQVLLSNSRLTTIRLQLVREDASLPEEALMIVDTARVDVIRHADWLSEALDNRLWDPEALEDWESEGGRVI